MHNDTIKLGQNINLFILKT